LCIKARMPALTVLQAAMIVITSSLGGSDAAKAVVIAPITSLKGFD